MTIVIEPAVVDGQRWRQAAAQARKLKLQLPTFSQLAHPALPSSKVWQDIASVAPDEPGVANLWRMHWYNSADRMGRDLVPGHIVLSKENWSRDGLILRNRRPCGRRQVTIVVAVLRYRGSWAVGE